MIHYFNGYVLFPLLDKVAKRHVFEKYRLLKRFEKLSVDEQRRVQKDELFKCLLYCQNEVPYYKDLFRANSFEINKVRSDIKYLTELPVLTKEIIRENIGRLKSDSAIHPRKTGGSTGQSIFFYYDDEGMDWTAAINLMAYDMGHNYLHRKDCHISSELGLLPTHWKPKFIDWFKLFVHNRKRLMISAFSDEILEKNVKDLERIRPYMLQGHPSSAYAIAEYIERHNYPRKRYCHVFEPSGEMLTEKIVTSIEENLGAKVVNRYGNAEFGVVAHSRFDDSYTKLKVFERAFYVEECNSENLIISNFTNYGMPLLRYDTCDVGTVKIEDDGAYIYDIQGRIHDTVEINNEGYATHYIMDYLDHKVGNVREFQILLMPDRNPVLTVVSENSEDNERIKNELQIRWPSGLDVKFIEYEELKRVGWRQKFRHVIKMHREDA